MPRHQRMRGRKVLADVLGTITGNFSYWIVYVYLY